MCICYNFLMEKKTVLVIDDNKDLRSALTTALEVSGFSVLQAENGEVGLAMALAHKPDLTLLDIRMPKMNGHQTLNEIRKHSSWGKDAHVLFLTAMDDVTNIAQGIELGSDDYIIKSNASLESIIKKVKQHIAGYHD